MLWKDKYRLGVALIDEQHMELFRRVDAFLTTLRATDSWEEKVTRVNETLEFMKAYVVEHFRDEEAYQREIGYPAFEAHQKIHKDMVAYVVSFSAEYESRGCNEQMIQQFAGKLLTWLINHVAAEDQKIATYAIGKGATQA